MVKFIFHQLIYQLTDASIIQEFIVVLQLIRVLSLVHYRIPLLQTTTQLVILAFGLIEKVQNMKSSVATFSGTRRELPHMEQFMQEESLILMIPVFLRTQHQLFSIHHLPHIQSHSQTALLTKQQIMDT